MEGTKTKLGELSGKISEAKNANSSTIENVKNAIKVASEVFEQLIGALTKLASVTNDSSTDIGVNADNGNVAAVKVDAGKDGGQVTAAGGATDAIAALGGYTSQATQGAGGDKLADEVSKADPLAIIDKIKNAEAVVRVLNLKMLLLIRLEY